MVWYIPSREKDIYLTFDDGPTPGITSQVLAFLLAHNAKATFFCLGSKIEQSSQIFEEIRLGGHAIGNHGYNHVSGFSCGLQKYTANVRQGAEISGSKLFRPPYGRISPWQIKRLKKDYKLIMWGIMSMDFKQTLTSAKCLQNVIRNIKPGAIILFHDTEEAKENVLQVLPELLDWIDKNGYQAKALS